MKKLSFIIFFAVLLTFSKNVLAQVYINEVFPNPEGKDDSKEWIELYNDSDLPINLSGWKITAKKTYIFPKNSLIAKKTFLAIENLPFSLNNLHQKLQLFNKKDELIDHLVYSKAKQGLSYSKSLIKKNRQQKHQWFWTENSKNRHNKTFYEISGSITTRPQINKDFFFEIITPQNKNLKIIFEQKNHQFEVLKLLFQKGTVIHLLAEKLSENTYLLKEYSISNSPSEINKNYPPRKWEYLLLVPISILFALVLLLIYKKKH